MPTLLFSPLTIRNITFKNRIVISPMCQYSSVDGFANDWHLVHLGSRAIGGAALIIQEATAVSPEGRISYADAGIWKDEHIAKWKEIVSFIKQHGAVAGIQLAHAGRKASHNPPWIGNKQNKEGENSWETLAPSAIPFMPEEKTPIALSIEEIQRIIADFKAAAQRAVQAGYEVIEIHAAHGYLVNEFLSPLSNQRTDEYGGSFENRIRFLLEIVAATRSVWPLTHPLFVRISATDWIEDGWNGNDSVQLASILQTKEVDLIDCSTGGNVAGVKIPLTPGYQVSFAEKVKQEANILTGAVGLITTATQAEEILQNQQADMIFIARASLRDAYWPYTAAVELKESIEAPEQYQRGWQYGFKV